MNLNANYKVEFPKSLNDFQKQSYFWPVQKSELEAVRDEFISNYYKFLGSEAKQCQSALVMLIIIDLLGQVLRCYQVQTLVARTRSASLQHSFSKSSIFANRFIQGDLSIDLSGAQPLIRGMEKSSLLKANLRWVKSRFQKKSLERPLISRVNMDRQIVTIATGEMISLHAKTKESVVHLGFENWFSKQDAYTKTFAGDIPKHLVDGIIDIVEAAFLSQGEALQNITRDYIRLCILKNYEKVDGYIGSLLLNSQTIPKTLWRGTGGLIWSRMLGFCCREIGGDVSGHDHSHGQGAWKSNSDQIIEYPFCDKFYVWTENQRKRSVENISSKLNFGYNEPIICVVPRGRPSLSKVPVGKSEPASKLRLMYVGTTYVVDRTTFSPTYPATVMLDWEIRFFREAIKQNFEVIYKPHPENFELNEKKLLKELGVSVIYDKFEKVMDQCDVAVFGQTNCSSFFSCLKTSRPIVLATPPLNPWHDDLQPIVDARCATLETQLDKNSQLQTDWSLLKDKVYKSLQLTDNRLALELVGG